MFVPLVACFFPFDPVDDAKLRLPPADYAYQAMRFSVEYEQYVKVRLGFDQANFWYWREVLAENELLWGFWSKVYWLQAGMSQYQEHELVDDIRSFMGDEAFYSGTFPPMVPVNRFHVRDP